MQPAKSPLSITQSSRATWYCGRLASELTRAGEKGCWPNCSWLLDIVLFLWGQGVSFWFCPALFFLDGIVAKAGFRGRDLGYKILGRDFG